MEPDICIVRRINEPSLRVDAPRSSRFVCHPAVGSALEEIHASVELRAIQTDWLSIYAH